MKNKKDDRRSQRTRQLLNKALLELMLEKQYDSLTVQHIIDRANVGRSTFYAHFMDKEDLLVSGFGRLIGSLEQQMVDSGEATQQILPGLELFRHVQQHHYLYKAFVWGRGVELIFNNVQAQLSRLIEQRLLSLAQNNAPPSVPLPVLANFVAGAFLTLIKWWFDGNLTYSAEQINDMFWRMVKPGVESVLGESSWAAAHHDE